MGIRACFGDDCKCRCSYCAKDEKPLSLWQAAKIRAYVISNDPVLTCVDDLYIYAIDKLLNQGFKTWNNKLESESIYNTDAIEAQRTIDFALQKIEELKDPFDLGERCKKCKSHIILTDTPYRKDGICWNCA